MKTEHKPGVIGMFKDEGRWDGGEENQISYHTRHKDGERLVLETELHCDKPARMWPKVFSPHNY